MKKFFGALFVAAVFSACLMNYDNQCQAAEGSYASSQNYVFCYQAERDEERDYGGCWGNQQGEGCHRDGEWHGRHGGCRN